MTKGKKPEDNENADNENGINPEDGKNPLPPRIQTGENKPPPPKEPPVQPGETLPVIPGTSGTSMRPLRGEEP